MKCPYCNNDIKLKVMQTFPHSVDTVVRRLKCPNCHTLFITTEEISAVKKEGKSWQEGRTHYNIY